jgi:undecaprenyl diphosphate synthase
VAQASGAFASHGASDGAKVPLHVAIVMDGNGRWAEQRGLPRLTGHRAGVDNIQPVLQALARRGVQYVSLYAFSTENWNRPATEVAGLMDILRESIERETQALHEQGVRILHLGRLDRLSRELRESIIQAQERTRNNQGVTLSVAFDYGGRAEIVEALKNIIRDGLSPDELDEKCIARYLYTSMLPDPDLIIRTGGELRLSNFFLWQTAYSEYYPTPTLWPDLGPEEVGKALEDYSGRQRRFGNIRNGA